MIEKIGKRALVLPLVMALGLCCILSLAVGPMLRAEPTNVPFAIVNLDEGAITVAGNTNVGQTLADKLISGESSLGDMGSDSDDGSNSSGTNDSSSESSDDGGNSSAPAIRTQRARMTPAIRAIATPAARATALPTRMTQAPPAWQTPYAGFKWRAKRSSPPRLTATRSTAESSYPPTSPASR